METFGNNNNYSGSGNNSLNSQYFFSNPEPEPRPADKSNLLCILLIYEKMALFEAG